MVWWVPGHDLKHSNTRSCLALGLEGTIVSNKRYTSKFGCDTKSNPTLLTPKFVQSYILQMLIHKMKRKNANYSGFTLYFQRATKLIINLSIDHLVKCLRMYYRGIRLVVNFSLPKVIYRERCYFYLAYLYNVSFENLSLPSFSKTFS